MIWLLVFLGGGLGSVARFGLGTLALQAGLAGWWATLAINVAGSALIGYAAARAPSDGVRAFVMVGLCGGFTTFSAFSLQTVELWRAGAPARAAANVVLSVALCMLAAGLAAGGAPAAARG